MELKLKEEEKETYALMVSRESCVEASLSINQEHVKGEFEPVWIGVGLVGTTARLEVWSVVGPEISRPEDKFWFHPSTVRMVAIIEPEEGENVMHCLPNMGVIAPITLWGGHS
ncbi:uncharacterized protein VTP21DRAFT_10731 [Calcarisporiella thermophila]|uniref:uncharacterized protein n=1 Tax=Calcarisporiella thermophila TaxID=911321 RepID=UPI00374453F5